jgi:hypothetical protein
MFRVRTVGVAECLYVAGQQEIERLELFWLGLTIIQFGQGPDNRRTTHGHATHSRPIFEFQILPGRL